MDRNSYHEALDALTDDTRTMHRALVSVMEELEAAQEVAEG